MSYGGHVFVMSSCMHGDILYEENWVYLMPMTSVNFSDDSASNVVYVEYFTCSNWNDNGKIEINCRVAHGWHHGLEASDGLLEKLIIWEMLFEVINCHWNFEANKSNFTVITVTVDGSWARLFADTVMTILGLQFGAKPLF